MYLMYTEELDEKVRPVFTTQKPFAVVLYFLFFFSSFTGICGFRLKSQQKERGMHDKIKIIFCTYLQIHMWWCHSLVMRFSQNYLKYYFWFKIPKIYEPFPQFHLESIFCLLDPKLNPTTQWEHSMHTPDSFGAERVSNCVTVTMNWTEYNDCSFPTIDL